MAKHSNKQNATPATPAAQPAPAAQAPAAPVASAAPVNAALAVIYKAGKPYNVRQGTAQANDRTWAALQEVLQASGGQATMGALVTAAEKFNHKPFVQYCIRRGWLTTAAA